MYDQIISFVKNLYGWNSEPIPLHEPVFIGNEKAYILDCIDSTYVSSVGEYVNLFEKKISEYTGSSHAIATSNGTAALHIALLLAGVEQGDEVITQSISFVATANAIRYCGADPIFLDSDRRTLGLSSDALEYFLESHCVIKGDGKCYNKKNGKRISACLPMHVFGHPADIERIKSICDKFNLILVEDAAEAIGSFFNEKHTGTFGKLGVLSFNGNKTITTGGGGMILTNDHECADLAKHLTTTAKVNHPWGYFHDRIGYNYRLPNINAALGCAQLEKLPYFLEKKRTLAERYRAFFKSIGVDFLTESKGSRSNYWLNAIFFRSLKERDDFIDYSHKHGVIVRPLWCLIPDLPMYKKSQTDSLENARWLSDRIVNIPSGLKNET